VEGYETNIYIMAYFYFTIRHLPKRNAQAIAP